MEQFVLFGRSHINALMVILVFTAFGPWLIKRYFTPQMEYYFRISLIALIWGQEIALNLWRIHNNVWELKESLTLHLCGLAILVLPVMLATKKYFLYELTYFWGMGGATQALLTPNIIDPFPSFRFFQFFLSHGVIVFTVIYATLMFNFQPTFRSVGKAFLVTVSLMLPIGIINSVLGTNYFFIAHKPETASILDIMGPWPWYLIPLVGLGAVIFLLVYLPFPVIRRFSKPVSIRDDSPAF
ncbi:MAG TPA: TIGR02206 family membrane protein [Candidatus Marinimicrobia bacterium]|nr:TIGR02206 family membrane protein [Candidatus Neomarinimicrobiota bacterium]